VAALTAGKALPDGWFTSSVTVGGDGPRGFRILVAGGRQDVAGARIGTTQILHGRWAAAHIMQAVLTNPS
jgi:hypothetical protein